MRKNGVTLAVGSGTTILIFQQLCRRATIALQSSICQNTTNGNRIAGSYSQVDNFVKLTHILNSALIISPQILLCIRKGRKLKNLIFNPSQWAIAFIVFGEWRDRSFLVLNNSFARIPLRRATRAPGWRVSPFYPSQSCPCPPYPRPPPYSGSRTTHSPSRRKSLALRT